MQKKLGITVRTLRYKDKLGLNKLSGHIEGNRRLYADKDIFNIIKA